MEKLKNLQRVDLDHNNISEINQFDFKKYGYLELSENKITSLKSFETIQNLTQLHLNNNQITNLNLSKKLNDLLVLSLKNNKILKIDSLDKLPNLEESHLSDDKIIIKKKKVRE